MTPGDFKAWRKSLGLSQKKAADALGLKNRIVQYYEKGERDGDKVKIPKHVRLACYALSLGVGDYHGPGGRRRRPVRIASSGASASDRPSRSSTRPHLDCEGRPRHAVAAAQHKLHERQGYHPGREPRPMWRRSSSGCATCRPDRASGRRPPDLRARRHRLARADLGPGLRGPGRDVPRGRRASGGLEVQLVYYRGFGECKCQPPGCATAGSWSG